MVLAVSFSMPVEASSSSTVWTEVASGASGTVNKSYSNANYSVFLDSNVYITKVDQSTGSTSYFTGRYCYVFWRLKSFSASKGYQYRIRNLSLSIGSNGALAYDFLLGTTAEVVNITAPTTSGIVSNSNYFYYEGTGDAVYLWLRALIFVGSSDPSVSMSSVSYSYNSVERRFFGTDESINASVNDVYKSVNNQTTSINNNITQQTQQQTNTLTGGYDNSGMEDSNTALSGSMNDYAAVEDQVMDQSVSYIDDVGFVSPASNSSIFATITFTSSWLQSLFNNMGDWSLLILVSLSLSLGLMLIGWFKYR